MPWADVNLLPVPTGVDDERAVFVGDVLTTGFYAASLTGADAGDVVAVFGAGPGGVVRRRVAASPRGRARVRARP